jgi:hypothetical protein
MKKEIIVVMIAMMLVLPLASANIFDFITGNAASNPTDVNIPVSNTAPIITAVSAISAQDPAEGSARAVAFTFTAYDHDDYADINTTSGSATFTNGGEATRSAACTAGSGSGKTISFTCSIDMWYWDAAGTWTVTASVKDLSAASATNDTTSFTYNSLTAFVMSPSILTWDAIAPGATNQASNNDPTLMNNTGNYVSSNIQINATSLVGQTSADYKIGADLFVANIADSCAAGTALSNSTYIQVASAGLNRGNLSAGSSAQEEVYYCLTLMPAEMTKQTYSTTGAGAWTLKVT